MRKYVTSVGLLALLAVAGCTDTDQERGNAHTNEEEIDEGNEPRLTIDEKYLNDVIEVDGVSTLANPENIAANVNPEYRLPDGYEPPDLVAPDIRFSFDDDVDKRYVREEAGAALEELFAAAEMDGHILYAISGYRSFDRQESIYGNAINQDGADQDTVAEPGHSEHQTGLAMDVSSESVNMELTTEFKETPEGSWLAENAHHFGFIIRYPEGADEITGYSYEPWHLRYVGEEVAQDIFDNQFTLEEYHEEVVGV
ncbi:M15 family metallopeptidase [Bacillus sp. JCM 19041]|uniref:M15 family metallopeptidase n=1 Tax=Bacillus sp. JCM 19041 TaxID=1460637 RepID=UPI00336AE345